MTTNDALVDLTIVSYAERRCDLQEDEGGTELRLRNTGPDDHNRAKITQAEIGSLGIIASLLLVQYGTWNGKPAALVGFRFQFQSGNNHHLRFRSADIIIEFSSRPVGPPLNDPEVQNYGPKSLRSIITTEQRSWHYQATLSAQATAGPVEIGPELEIGREGTFPRNYATTVTGDDYGNRHHRLPNCVKFWMKEDKKQESGVPLDVRTAIIVAHKGPFQASVQVLGRTVIPIPLKTAHLWSKDDPVLLQPGIEYGVPPRVGADVNFESLTQDEWRTIVTPDLHFRYV